MLVYIGLGQYESLPNSLLTVAALLLFVGLARLEGESVAQIVRNLEHKRQRAHLYKSILNEGLPFGVLLIENSSVEAAASGEVYYNQSFERLIPQRGRHSFDNRGPSPLSTKFLHAQSVLQSLSMREAVSEAVEAQQGYRSTVRNAFDLLFSEAFTEGPLQGQALSQPRMFSCIYQPGPHNLGEAASMQNLQGIQVQNERLQ